MKKSRVIVASLLAITILFLITSQVFAGSLSKVTNLVVTTTDTRASLNWSKVTGASGYEVYLSISNRSYINLGSVPNNYATITGFTRGETYKIKIKAYQYENGKRVYGAWSDEITFTINRNESNGSEIGKVTGLKVNTSGSKVNLQWNSVTGASGYNVYVNIPGYGYADLGNVTGNQASVSGFGSNKTYGIKVRAYQVINGQKVYGAFSNESSFRTTTSGDITLEENIELDQVSNLRASVSGTEVNLTWNSVSGASGYEVYVTIPGYGYTTYTTSRTSITLSDITADGNYTAKVIAYREVDGKKQYGKDYSTTVQFKHDDVTLDKVYGVEADLTDNKVKITWDKVTGASGYEVYMTTPYGNETYTTSATNKTVTLSDKGNYTVEITAYKTVNGRKVWGNSSKTISFYYGGIDLGKVYGVDADVTDNKVKITWDKVTGASGYEVYMTTPYGDETYTTSSTSKTVTLSDEGNYTVEVTAYKLVNGKKQWGDPSKTVKFNYQEANLGKVYGVDADVTDNKVKITWDKVTGASGYEVYMTTPDGDKTYTTSSTNKTVTLSEEGNYKVEVTAYKTVNGKKKWGDSSKTVKFSYDVSVGKVYDIDADVTGSKVKITWDKVTGASGYQIYVTDPNGNEKSYTTTATNKTITGLSKTGTYDIEIRAYKTINGKKKYGKYGTASFVYRSSSSSTSDLAKVTGLKVIKSGTAVTYQWNRVSGADGYEICLTIPGIGDCYYIVYGTSRYMTGLTSSYQYKVKVRAFEEINGRRVYAAYSTPTYFYTK